MITTTSILAYKRAQKIHEKVIAAGKRGEPFPTEHLCFYDIVKDEYEKALQQFERMRDRMRL